MQYLFPIVALLCLLSFYYQWKFTTTLIDEYGVPKGDHAYLIPDSYTQLSSVIGHVSFFNNTSDGTQPSKLITRKQGSLNESIGASPMEMRKYSVINEHDKSDTLDKPKEHGGVTMAKATQLLLNQSQNTATETPRRSDLVLEETKHETPIELAPTIPSVHQMNNQTSAIVVVGCKRLNYVINMARALEKQPEIGKYSLFLSLGCMEFLNKNHLQNIKELAKYTILEYDDAKQLGSIPKPFKRIQLHYRFFLQVLFESYHFNRVIILEDDLELSPSLLNFFEATSPLLDQDETIACISAFNDNAMADKGDPKLLRRSSYFPNLALMFSLRSYNKIWKDQVLTRSTNGWDHWLRIRSASLHMEGVFPVVPRVRHGCSENSTTAKGMVCRKLRVYPLFGEKSMDLGNLNYILGENYDRFLLSQFFDPEKIEQAIQLFSLSEEILLQPNRTIPDFNPSYLSNVNVQVFKHSAVMSILKSSNTVNVLLIVREELRNVFFRFNMFAAYRGFHRGIIPLHQNNKLIFIIDRRQWMLVPREHAILPNPWGKIMISKRGESCDEACHKEHLACDFVQQEFLNNCHTMQHYFGCPYGCWNEVDKYIPAFSEDGKDYDKLCLISYDAFSFCSVKQHTSSRLCYCIPGEKIVSYSIHYRVPRTSINKIISFKKVNA